VTEKTIRLYFKELDRRLQAEAEVILVGAGADSLMGHIRPSLDIDFEIRLKTRSAKKRRLLDRAVKEAASAIGVAVNYSEDIGHWSMVSYLDYRKTALFYRRIGKLTVKLIAPEYWTIGKMTRFLELDIRDMVKVIQKKKLRPARLVRVWSRAAKDSGLSLELGQFKEHALFFLKKYGKKLWGRSFNVEKTGHPLRL
jgi:hypothetical protein